MSINWGALIPIAVDAGTKWWSQQQQSKADQGYNNAIRQREEWAFNNAQHQHAAYQEYVKAMQGNQGAMLGAFHASEAARMQALQQAMAIAGQYGEQSREDVEPFAAMGRRLIPAVEQTYGAGLAGLGKMAGVMLDDKGMAPLGNSSNITGYNLGKLPERLTQQTPMYGGPR